MVAWWVAWVRRVARGRKVWANEPLSPGLSEVIFTFIVLPSLIPVARLPRMYPVCEKKYTADNFKMRDHCHLTAKCRSPSETGLHAL